MGLFTTPSIIKSNKKTISFVHGGGQKPPDATKDIKIKRKQQRI
jgi:hypothetical protein